ncbi:MAG: CBS domain-containing protein [Desulfovibrionales bacterium]
MNKQDELKGVLSLRDLRSYLGEFDKYREKIRAKDLMTTEVITLRALDDLEKAMRMFERHHVSMVPVTAPEHPRLVLGVLLRDDLLQAYNEKVLKNRLLSAHSSRRKQREIFRTDSLSLSKKQDA